MRTLVLSLLTGGCSDYELKAHNDGEGTLTDTAIVPEVNACDSPQQPSPASVIPAEECDVGPQTGQFTPMVEWSGGTSAFCGPAAAAQIIDTNGSGGIDADDLPVILIYQNSRVQALWGDGSGTAWTTTATYGQDGGFAVGDLDADGWPDVVTADNTKVCALDGRTGDQKWCTSGLSSHLDYMGYTYPSIADMNGDGQPEVTAGNVIMKGADGMVLGRGNRGMGAAPYQGDAYFYGSYGAVSVPIDLDGDGQMELVTGNAAYDINGGTKWTNNGQDGLVAVADFDGDGQGEMIKTSGIYVIAMESNGTELWTKTYYGANIGSPAIDDLDGDGVPEFVFASSNQLIAMEFDGTQLWSATIDDGSGAAGPTLFDFELDGFPEVLYADESTVRFFSGLDGSVKFSSSAHASYTILETPIVADVDGDDQVEIVVGHCSPTGGIGAVTVYGDGEQTWPPGRKVWNQHAYSITNINDDGTVPGVQSNWPQFNSFRSGDVGLPPGEYIDLRGQILDICDDECDEGTVYVAGWLLNAGNVDSPPGVSIALRAGNAGPIIDVKTLSAAIPAGSSSEMVVFEASASDLAGKVPVIVADTNASGNGIVTECYEENNGDAWDDSVCY